MIKDTDLFIPPVYFYLNLFSSFFMWEFNFSTGVLMIPLWEHNYPAP